MKFSKTKRVYVVEVPHQGPIRIYSGSKAAIVNYSLEKHDNTKRFRSFEEYFRQLTADTHYSFYFESQQELEEYITRTFLGDPIEGRKLQRAYDLDNRLTE